MLSASGHNYWNSSFIMDVAMGQIPRSTERISSCEKWSFPTCCRRLLLTICPGRVICLLDVFLMVSRLLDLSLMFCLYTGFVFDATLAGFVMDIVVMIFDADYWYAKRFVISRRDLIYFRYSSYWFSVFFSRVRDYFGQTFGSEI